MKILLFVDKLFGGGAERVASILLNHLCKNHNVTAIIFNDDRYAYSINPKVRICKISINKRIRIIHPIERIFKIRKTIKNENPDLIISFLVDVSRFVLLANIFLNKRIIISEHITIQNKQSIQRYFTRHMLYPLGTKVVLLTNCDYKFAKWLNNKTVIYNPLSFPITTDYYKNEKSIITIGPQQRWHKKGFDMLVQAWAKIAPQHPDWRLQFIGTNESTKIIGMVKDFGLETQVDFLGWTNEIEKVLQTKSIYVLSSRREGFPCSLLEAMSQGCACLAFDCKTGPNEIITDGVSGLLARNGDIDDLAAKLQLLIEDEQLRRRLAAAATEEVSRFEKDKIMRRWDELIQSTVEQ